MKTITLPIKARTDIMRLMRAYGMPDETIAGAFSLSRQRAHVLMGPRPRDPIELAPVDATAAERLPSVLKAWRIKHDLSQTEAAKILGVRHGFNSVSKWERSAGGCAQPEVLIRLIELLDQHGLT